MLTETQQRRQYYHLRIQHLYSRANYAMRMYISILASKGQSDSFWLDSYTDYMSMAEKYWEFIEKDIQRDTPVIDDTHYIQRIKFDQYEPAIYMPRYFDELNRLWLDYTPLGCATWTEAYNHIARDKGLPERGN